MKILDTLYFKDISSLTNSVLEQYETYQENQTDEDFLGVSIAAPYEVLIDVLNYIVKNTSFTMKNIHLEDGECADYWDEWILTIDPEGHIWTQVAKYESGYIFTEDNVVYVHGDVNSAFVKNNENENLIAFEIGEKEDSEDSVKTDSETSDSKNAYHISVKCNLDADEALHIIKDMEKRINRMNDAFAEMDKFRRLFR